MLPKHIPQTVCQKKVSPLMRRWDFLQAMITANKWESGAELGLWRGKTTSHLLRTCTGLRLIGVDLWSPLGDGGHYDEANWKHANYERECRERCAPFQDRLTILKERTVSAARKVPDHSLDFVFIDADHSEKGVREDVAAWLPKIKPNGCIMGHDINWPGVRAAVDDLVPGYLIGPDVVWFRPVNPVQGWEKVWQ